MSSTCFRVAAAACGSVSNSIVTSGRGIWMSGTCTMLPQIRENPCPMISCSRCGLGCARAKVPRSRRGIHRRCRRRCASRCDTAPSVHAHTGSRATLPFRWPLPSPCRHSSGVARFHAPPDRRWGTACGRSSDQSVQPSDRGPRVSNTLSIAAASMPAAARLGCSLPAWGADNRPSRFR